MTESLESVQVNSKKLIGSNARVWLVLLSLPLIIVDIHAQLIALILFSALSLHASKYFLRLLILPAVFIVFSVAVILFTIDGKEILSLYFLRITDKSLEVALSTLLRCFSALSAFCYLILTTTLPEFINTLRVKGFLREIMLLGYRSIQILLEEVENLKISADARLGFFGFRRRLRTTALMSYMIFLKSMEKVDKFEKAKMARCYNGVFPSRKVKGGGEFYALLSFLAILSGVFI